MFSKEKSRVRLYNEAYQRGFEEGVRHSTEIAKLTCEKVARKYQSQFHWDLERSDSHPETRKYTAEIPVCPGEIDTVVFRAQAVVGRFLIEPNRDGYATFNNGLAR